MHQEDSDQAPARTVRGTGGSMLAAAMLGLGQVLEPERTEVTIEQEGDQPLDDDPLASLDFAGLPPIDGEAPTR